MDKLAALGQMAATMAHKIRNPLGGIVGFAGLLDLEMRGNDHGRRLVGKITEGVQKLNRIVSSLVSYTSRISLHPRTYDLGGGLGEIFGAFESGLEGGPAKVVFSLLLPDGPVAVEADREQLNAALQIIVQNAAEAVDGEGGVTALVLPGVSRYTPPCQAAAALLEKMRGSSRLLYARMPCGIALVTDTGAGMSAEAERNLFVPFFTTKENGIGLGLASAKKIIEAHHGEIWVASLKGRGTSVGIILPCMSTASS